MMFYLARREGVASHINKEKLLFTDLKKFAFHEFPKTIETAVNQTLELICSLNEAFIN